MITKLLVVSGLIFFLIRVGSANPIDSIKIKRQVISSGGSRGETTGKYKVVQTTGEPVTGTAKSAHYGVAQGFLPGHGPLFNCGDANLDGRVNVADAVRLINYVFVPGTPAPRPLVSGDVNCSSKVNVADAVYIINYVFVPGSPRPCEDCP